MKKTIFILLILIQSCNSENKLEISGQWKYLNTNDDDIIQPFKSFCPSSSDDFQCYEIVYITENQIEHPLIIGKKEFKVTDKYIKYELLGNKIRLSKDSLSFEYNWNYRDNKLCLDNGKFCIEKLINKEIKLDSTIFKFDVFHDELPSYTIWLNYNYMQRGKTCEINYNEPCEPYKRIKIQMTEDEMDYIIQLLERVPSEQLNRIYNNGLSDCREISIDFYTANGNWQGIETCGLTVENPFELRALINNVFWIMHKYLKRK